MTKFEEALRFWLASHGLTQEESDTVCADRRVAYSIKLADEGGIVQDIVDALYRAGNHGTAAASALYNAGEKLLLMTHLRRSKNERVPRARKPPKVNVQRSLTLTLKFGPSGAGTWTASGSNRTLPLTPEDVRLLAGLSMPQRAVFHLPKPVDFPGVLVTYSVNAEKLCRWLKMEFGMRGTDAIETQVEALADDEGDVPQLSLLLTLDTSAYLEFFEAKGVIR